MNLQFSRSDLWTAGAMIESTPRIFKCQPPNWTAEPCSDSSFTKDKHIPPKKKDSESLLYPITYVRVELYISV